MMPSSRCVFASLCAFVSCHLSVAFISLNINHISFDSTHSMSYDHVIGIHVNGAATSTPHGSGNRVPDIKLMQLLRIQQSHYCIPSPGMCLVQHCDQPNSGGPVHTTTSYLQKCL